jgi:hypothetical protein
LDSTTALGAGSGLTTKFPSCLPAELIALRRSPGPLFLICRPAAFRSTRRARRAVALLSAKLISRPSAELLSADLIALFSAEAVSLFTAELIGLFSAELALLLRRSTAPLRLRLVLQRFPAARSQRRVLT